MCLDTDPIGPGLSFFISIPRKSMPEIRTLMILSSISFLTTKIEAATKSYAYFLSSTTKSFKDSFMI